MNEGHLGKNVLLMERVAGFHPVEVGVIRPMRHRMVNGFPVIQGRCAFKSRGDFSEGFAMSFRELFVFTCSVRAYGRLRIGRDQRFTLEARTRRRGSFGAKARRVRDTPVRRLRRNLIRPRWATGGSISKLHFSITVRLGCSPWPKITTVIIVDIAKCDAMLILHHFIRVRREI